MKTTKVATSATVSEGPRVAPRDSHDDYAPMLEAHRVHYDKVVGRGNDARPLFTTAVTGDALWAVFIGSLPGSERQQHNCHECRRFIQQYGSLVVLNEHGFAVSAMWGAAPGIYMKTFRRLKALVESSVVTGVFLSGAHRWGTPQTPDPKHGCVWKHLAVSGAPRFKHMLLSADQRMAERKEEYGMLSRGLAEYPGTVIAQALSIARMDALYRGEKVLGHLEWLARLCAARAAVPNARKPNVTWLAVASAPAGFCHLKTSVVSTLLDDLLANVPLDVAQKKFAEKLNPTKYLRPVAAPKAGTIAQAEKAIEGLQAAGALNRRYARLEECHTLWVPADVRKTPPKGVFAHLVQPDVGARGHLSGGKVTWEKFAREVLPLAQSMKVLVPSQGNFLALVTAVDRSAPPILQWDNEDNRNPTSWYVYSQGSPARQWSLASGWAKVSAVVPMPFMWPGTVNHGNHGAGVILTIPGCRDIAHRGNAIFPETLRSELHGVRSVIEAYSRRASLGGQWEGDANGLSIRKGSDYQTTVRVTLRGGTTAEYTIDRWD